MMLAKLRRRIVLVLMAAFTLLIAGVVGCMSAIQAQQAVERQKQILRSVAVLPMTEQADASQEPDYASGTPFFAVRLDAQGNVASVYRHGYAISEARAARAAERALRSGRISGVLREQQQRYLVRTEADGTARVTFISMAQDAQQQRRQTLYALLLIPALMLPAFFFIALPLSRWLTRPVQRAWDAQRVFIADASHELKTPLTVILANLSILLRNRTQTIERCEGWLVSTQEEAQCMRELVEAMLTLARAEDEQAAEVFAETDLSEMLKHAVMVIEPLAFERGVTLDAHIQPGIAAVCSQTHIRQMMMILLDNAIKYAGGEKRVTVTLSGRPGRCSLRVTNTGTPIPADALPHVFDRFYRVDAGRAGGGFGLGLAIAKRIAQMHRGAIRVESSAEAGTTFCVTLPTKNAARPGIAGRKKK